MKRLSGLTFAALFALLVSPNFALAKIYVLTVGIDTYEHISDLHGAVNDSNDVRDALTNHQDAEVRQLLNAEATRENFRRQWGEIAAAAGEGDLIVLHFAGHGAQQEAIFPATNIRPTSNMILMHGFDESRSGSRQRILDVELAWWLREETDANILVLLDSCYSGGMRRSSSAQPTLRRLPSEVSFQDDALLEGVRALGPPPTSVQENALFISASGSNEPVLEVAIDGQQRGAATFALARAFEGASTRAGQTLNTVNLATSIIKTVSFHTANAQLPSVSNGSSFVLDVAPPQEASPVATGQRIYAYITTTDSFDARGKTIGRRALSNFLSHPNLELVQDASKADMIVQLQTDRVTIRSDIGDLVLMHDLSRSLRYFGVESVQTYLTKCGQPQTCAELFEGIDIDAFVLREVFARNFAQVPSDFELEIWLMNSRGPRPSLPDHMTAAQFIDAPRLAGNHYIGEGVALYALSERRSHILAFAITQDGYLIKAQAPNQGGDQGDAYIKPVEGYQSLIENHAANPEQFDIVQRSRFNRESFSLIEPEGLEYFFAVAGDLSDLRTFSQALDQVASAGRLTPAAIDALIIPLKGKDMATAQYALLVTRKDG